MSGPTKSSTNVLALLVALVASVNVASLALASTPYHPMSAEEQSRSLVVMFPTGTVQLGDSRDTYLLSEAIGDTSALARFESWAPVYARKVFPGFVPGDTLRTIANGVTVRIPDFADVLLLTFPDSLSMQSAAAVLDSDSSVVFVDAVGPVVTNRSPSDSMWTSTSSYQVRGYLDSTYASAGGGTITSQASIRSILGWDITTGSDSVTIAVIDDGVDYRHVELGSGMGPGKKVLPGFDFVQNDNDPLPTGRHGTGVAGIAAALTNNVLVSNGQKIGMAGIAGGWDFNAALQSGSVGARIIP